MISCQTPLVIRLGQPGWDFAFQHREWFYPPIKEPHGQKAKTQNKVGNIVINMSLKVVHIKNKNTT